MENSTLDGYDAAVLYLCQAYEYGTVNLQNMSYRDRQTLLRRWKVYASDMEYWVNRVDLKNGGDKELKQETSQESMSKPTTLETLVAPYKFTTLS